MARAKARTLAVFGTGSDVGKSLITAGLCRIFSNRGIDVCPYKAQNMSNNSGVTQQGAEIGRAQILQAMAARTEPHVDMNPVLLKPAAGGHSQIVLLGQYWNRHGARSNYQQSTILRDAAFAALDRLRSAHELVILEGAGSCAEVNLRERDFVNFQAAHHADARVALVADIDRGGVFAQVVGTLEVLSEEDRARISGIVINRFRGDITQFREGVGYLERRTGLPIYGVVPHLAELTLDEEDAVCLERRLDPPPIDPKSDSQRLRVAVVVLPRISNFTDFDPLVRHRAVEIHFLSRPRSLEPYDLLLLPGTKATLADLEWLRRTQWADAISRFAGASGAVGGICGGYQMLGREILDPNGLEGSVASAPGLALLSVETQFMARKELQRVRGRWLDLEVDIEGYEIHMGRTRSSERPTLALADTATRASAPEGATHENVWGTYVHGVFDAPGVVDALIRRLRPDISSERSPRESQSSFRDRELERLAAHLLAHLDVDAIARAAC